MLDKIKYKQDLIKNGRPSLFRKKRWLLYWIRKEQSSAHGTTKRICALFKKIILAGTGCEIPSNSIGYGIKFPHLNGIIIHDTARIGSNCTIFHQVTIGISESESDDADYSRKAPKVGDNVMIGAGAKLIGSIAIGNNVKIGANAVVTKNIPSNVTVVGANRVILNGDDKDA